jgi:hypothetical protein
MRLASTPSEGEGSIREPLSERIEQGRALVGGVFSVLKRVASAARWLEAPRCGEWTQKMWKFIGPRSGSPVSGGLCSSTVPV